MKEHKKIKILAKISYGKELELNSKNFIGDEVSLEDLTIKGMCEMFKNSVERDPCSFCETCNDVPLVEVTRIE